MQVNSQLFSSGVTTSSPSSSSSSSSSLLFASSSSSSCTVQITWAQENHLWVSNVRSTFFLPWEALQAVRLFRTRPPLELSGCCPKGMLTYSRKTQFWREHQEAVLSPYPPMAQVLSVLLFWGCVDKKRNCLSTQLLPRG